MPDRPDFATMRTALREFHREVDGRDIPCPRPSCTGTVERLDGRLRCTCHGSPSP